MAPSVGGPTDMGVILSILAAIGTGGIRFEVHVALSAVAPRSAEVDLQETAGKGPLGRCWTATSFWGRLTCGACRRCCSHACFGLRKIFCRPRWCCPRRATRPGSDLTSPRRELHEASETESEAEDGDHPCQARVGRPGRNRALGGRLGAWSLQGSQLG